MSMDDNDGQMLFGDLRGLKLPDICLTGEEKPRKNLTQETCPDWESNPGPLRDKSHATTCSTAVDAFLRGEDYGSEGSIAIVKKFDFDILIFFHST